MQQTTDFVRDPKTNVLLPSPQMSSVVSQRLREKSLTAELAYIKTSIKELDTKIDAIMDLLQSKLC
jgi:hypothetical protein